MYQTNNGTTYNESFRQRVCSAKQFNNGTWKDLAAAYNSMGFKTVRGGLFTATVLQSLTRRSVTRCL